MTRCFSRNILLGISGIYGSSSSAGCLDISGMSCGSQDFLKTWHLMMNQNQYASKCFKNVESALSEGKTLEMRNTDLNHGS